MADVFSTTEISRKTTITLEMAVPYSASINFMFKAQKKFPTIEIIDVVDHVCNEDECRGCDEAKIKLVIEKEELNNFLALCKKCKDPEFLREMISPNLP